MLAATLAARFGKLTSDPQSKPWGLNGRAELRYLPPYSPDLNPIERTFATLKKLLCDGAERTVDKLWERCARILEQFTEHECRNYFRHCGYRYT